MAKPEIRKRHAVVSIAFGSLALLFALVIVMCSFLLKGKISIPVKLTPYWAGLPFFLPGILGIVVGVTKNYHAMLGFMVSNIVCFMINGGAVTLLARDIGTYTEAASKLDEFNSCTSSLRESCVCPINGQKVVFSKVRDCLVLRSVNSLLWTIILFCTLSAILSLASSIFGIIAAFCSPRPEPRTVGFKQTYPNANYTHDSQYRAPTQPQNQTQNQPPSQPQYQPQSQPQYQPQSQPQYHPQSQSQYQPQSQPQYQPQSQPQYQPQSQAKYQPQSQPTQRTTRVPAKSVQPPPTTHIREQPTSQDEDDFWT